MRSNGTLNRTPHRFKSPNPLSSSSTSSLSQQKKANGGKLYVVNWGNGNANKNPPMSKQGLELNINTKSTSNILNPTMNKGNGSRIVNKAKSPTPIQMKNTKNAFRQGGESNGGNVQSIRKRTPINKSVNSSYDSKESNIKQGRSNSINNIVPLPKIIDDSQTVNKNKPMKLVNKSKVESYRNENNGIMITKKDIERKNKEAENILEFERLKEMGKIKEGERLKEAELFIENLKEADRLKEKDKEKNKEKENETEKEIEKETEKETEKKKEKEKEKEKEKKNDNHKPKLINQTKTADNARNRVRDIDRRKSNSIVLASKITMIAEDKSQLQSQSFSNDNDLNNYPPSFKTQSQKQVLPKEEIKTFQDDIIIEKPIKMYLKCSISESQAGKSDGGITKTNQDSYLLMTKVFNHNDFNIFGVLDGHGENGHLASRFSVRYIENQIINHPLLFKLKTIDDIYDKLRENHHDLIKQLFISTDKEIAQQDFDINFSGTTCVMIFQLGTHIISANAGDSRGILISEKEDETYEVKYLSIDQKPELKKEKNRIIKSGGRVDQCEDEGEKVGPFRVWLKDEQYPGLAMSRSIGDLIASQVGVIPDPAILEFELSNKKECIIVASDGVWEFLDNKNVMTLAKPYILKDNLKQLCMLLIQESTKKWEQEDVVVDDITVVSGLFMHCK